MMVNCYFPLKVDIPLSIKNSWEHTYKPRVENGRWMEWNTRVDYKVSTTIKDRVRLVGGLRVGNP